MGIDKRHPLAYLCGCKGEANELPKSRVKPATLLNRLK